MELGEDHDGHPIGRKSRSYRTAARLCFLKRTLHTFDEEDRNELGEIGIISFGGRAALLPGNICRRAKSMKHAWNMEAPGLSWKLSLEEDGGMSN